VVKSPSDAFMNITYVYVNNARVLNKDTEQFCQAATFFAICRSSKAQKRDVHPASFLSFGSISHIPLAKYLDSLLPCLFPYFFTSFSIVI